MTLFFVSKNGVYIGSFDGPIDELPLIFNECETVPYPPYSSSQIWNFEEETYGPAIPSLRTPSTIALSKLSITDGVIEGFTVDSALSGGFPIEVGKFMMFFAAPQPDINYIVNVFDGGLFRCYVQQEDYAEDYFTVTTTTLSGQPSDPACLSIIIMRAE